MARVHSLRPWPLMVLGVAVLALVLAAGTIAPPRVPAPRRVFEYSQPLAVAEMCSLASGDNGFIVRDRVLGPLHAPLVLWTYCGTRAHILGVVGPLSYPGLFINRDREAA
jgi:hypothetical protein